MIPLGKPALSPMSSSHRHFYFERPLNHSPNLRDLDLAKSTAIIPKLTFETAVHLANAKKNSSHPLNHGTRKSFATMIFKEGRVWLK